MYFSKVYERSIPCVHSSANMEYIMYNKGAEGDRNDE